MKSFRQIGEKEYQAVLRTKAAEESAALAEINNMDLINSQDSVVNDDTDNILASPVENSTGGALRL